MRLSFSSELLCPRSIGLRISGAPFQLSFCIGVLPLRFVIAGDSPDSAPLLRTWLKLSRFDLGALLLEAKRSDGVFCCASGG